MTTANNASEVNTPPSTEPWAQTNASQKQNTSLRHGPEHARNASQVEMSQKRMPVRAHAALIQSLQQLPPDIDTGTCRRTPSVLDPTDKGTAKSHGNDHSASHDLSPASMSKLKASGFC